MSVSVPHLVSEVIRPALNAMGAAYATEEAVLLVLGTGAVESGYFALRQSGGGPAVGFWQMEPLTHDDLWRTTIAGRPTVRSGLLHLAARGSGTAPPPASEMAWNLRYAAAMCRVHYLRHPGPLPAIGDLAGRARYWKRSYNTHLGAGRPEDFERAWVRMIEPNL